VSGEELSEGQCRAVWNRDAGWDHEARGAEANSVAATPGAVGRPQCGGGHGINARGRRWARDVVSRQHMHALREACCILTSPMGDLCPNLTWSSPATAKLGLGRTSDCGSTFLGSRSAAEVLDGPDSVSWEKALDERRGARILLGSKTSIVLPPGRGAQAPGASRPVYLSLTLIPLRNAENHVSLS
jgi:hypothetical protein